MYTIAILLCCSVGILFLSTEVEGVPPYAVPNNDPRATTLLSYGLLRKEIYLKELISITKTEIEGGGPLYKFIITCKNKSHGHQCYISVQDISYIIKTDC